MHDKSIDLLNKALADELSAIHQYMYFHFHCDDQGYDPLSRLFKAKAIEEMQHAERLAERILFLKGDVEMAPANPVQKIQDALEMLKCAKDLELAAVRMYNESAKQCAEHWDSASKQLFEALVVDEEGHYDAFDTQEEHLKKFGEQYLALQSIERAKTGASGAAPEA